MGKPRFRWPPDFVKEFTIFAISRKGTFQNVKHRSLFAVWLATFGIAMLRRLGRCVVFNRGDNPNLQFAQNVLGDMDFDRIEAQLA